MSNSMIQNDVNTKGGQEENISLGGAFCDHHTDVAYQREIDMYYTVQGGEQFRQIVDNNKKAANLGAALGRWAGLSNSADYYLQEWISERQSMSRC